MTAVFVGLPLLSSCALLHSRHAAHAAATGPTPPPHAAAARKPVPPVHSTTASASPEHRVGTVRVIGTGQRFVLIEVPPVSTGSLPDGQMLRCSPTPDGDMPTSATLRVARERRRPYVVADVVSGEPHIGDTVFAIPAQPSATATPTVLPTATSGVLPILLPAPSPGAHTP